MQRTDTRLIADGWWGARTESVFQRSEPDVQGEVTSFALVNGYQLDALRLPAAIAASRGRWVPRDKVVSLAERAAALMEIPVEWLLFMVEQEPRKRIVLGVKEYDAESIAPSGLYRGLYQLGQPAWTDASRVVQELGRFEDNWRDPWLSTLAAAAFAKVNMGYARSIHGFDGPFTSELIYAMHNQGHSFLSSARAGGLGRWADGQSPSARAVLAAAASQVRQLA